MKSVAKYNIFKGVSTVLTMGTPIITLAMCGDFFTETPGRTISATGMFALFLMLLLFKDKIAANWKMPSAFIVSLACLILIVMIKNIIEPVQYVCIATCISTGVDEITFKKFYTKLIHSFKTNYTDYQRFGFLFCKSEDVEVTIES